jgi:hypothetical protein
MTTMTDRQIDALVYQLYRQTEEEIRIVGESRTVIARSEARKQSPIQS